MTSEQVSALEQTLKMTDKQIAALPDEQRAMVSQFRDMWKENPEVFKKRPKKEGGQKEKNKENVHDPLRWMKEHQESLSWFTESFKEFDRDRFVKEESERVQAEEEVAALARSAARARVEEEARGLLGAPSFAEDKKGEGKKNKSKKKGDKKGDKKKELAELMGWAGK